MPIAHTRVSRAVNLTFRNMLIDEYRELGEPKRCHVYRDVRDDGSFTYFFSPAAAGVLAVFLDFWEGYKCVEPTDLAKMDAIIWEHPARRQATFLSATERNFPGRGKLCREVRRQSSLHWRTHETKLRRAWHTGCWKARTQ